MFKGETMDITFTEGDARMVHHPHSDALVVTAVIGNVNVHRLLVDNGSNVNILAYSAYHRMKMADKDMMAYYNELYDFLRKCCPNCWKGEAPNHPWSRTPGYHSSRRVHDSK